MIKKMTNTRLYVVQKKHFLIFSIGKIMIILNMQITNFIEDTFEVPARNEQSLLKIKIPAINSIFKNPSNIGQGQKVPTPTITVRGARTMPPPVIILKLDGIGPK